MADDVTRRQLEQNPSARIKLSGELVPGEYLYSLGPVTLPAKFANPQAHLFATMMSTYMVNGKDVYRYDNVEVVDLEPVENIDPKKDAWRQKVPGAIVRGRGQEPLLEFTRVTRSQKIFTGGQVLASKRQRWHKYETNFLEAISLMEGVVEEFNDRHAMPSNGSIKEVSLAGILTGCYGALINEERNAFESANDGDWHGNPWYEEVSEEKMLALKVLLEYGLQPNEFGRYEKGPMIVRDLCNGPEQFEQDSLIELTYEIYCIDKDLARDLQIAASYFFNIYLHRDMDNHYQDNIDGWNEVFGLG